MRAVVMFCCLFVIAKSVEAMISVDGELTEAEWRGAKSFTGFKRTFPNTGEPSLLQCKVLLLQTSEGIYLGFKNEQPEKLRTRYYSRRDNSSRADYNEVVIDLNGTGSHAYYFRSSLGGGVSDGTYLNGNQLNLDWDGKWYSAQSESKEYWYNELFIPWEELSATSQSNTNLGVWFGRKIASSGNKYSYPYTQPSRDLFLRELTSIPSSKPRKKINWSVAPHFSSSYDLINRQSENHVGVDLNVKSSSDFELSATINPDFGAVESDEIISNYSPYEVLLSEKRKFFTENHSVFDIQDDEFFVALNTRRIGAITDGEISAVPQVSHAFKYTQSTDRHQLGLMYARDRDESFARGKKFYAIRNILNFEGWNIGNLTTRTNSPEIGKKADVSIIDTSLWMDDFQLKNYTLYSNVINKEEEIEGAGQVFEISQSVTQNFNNYIKLTWFDENLQLNDFGYLERSDLLQVQFYQDYTMSPKIQSLDEIEFFYGAEFSENNSGERLSDYYEATSEFSFSDASSVSVAWIGLSSGVDDLLTFGGDSMFLPKRDEFYVNYSSPSADKWQYELSFRYFQEGFSDWAWEWELLNQLSITDTFTIDFKILRLMSNDWVIGSGEGVNELEQYEREYRELTFGLLYVNGNHELSGKFQWNGINATGMQRYAVIDKKAVPQVDYLGDFYESEMASQIRYMYKYGKKADLYLVYSRSGSFYEDRNTYIKFNKQLRYTLKNPVEDIITFKVSVNF